MSKLNQAAAGLIAACALAAFSMPASAAHFGHGGFGDHGGFHGGFGHSHFGHFGHGGFGHHRGFRGFGFYPGFAFYGGPYYDDYYYDDYDDYYDDDYDYCYWRHGRRFCRY